MRNLICSFFKEQAAQFGFDESTYLEALSEVPIVSKDTVTKVMDFLLNMTQLISEMTLQRIEQIELNEALRQSEAALRESYERFRIAQDMSPDGFTILRPIQDEQGIISDFSWVYENSAIAMLNGTDPEKIAGMQLLHLFPSHKKNSKIFRMYQEVAQSGIGQTMEIGYVGQKYH